jgi:hypothetical protein
MLEEKEKAWALLHIIQAAQAKAKEISVRNDGQEKQSLTDLLYLIDDAANKLSNLRWADKNSLDGIGFYLNSISHL